MIAGNANPRPRRGFRRALARSASGSSDVLGAPTASTGASCSGCAVNLDRVTPLSEVLGVLPARLLLRDIVLTACRERACARLRLRPPHSPWIDRRLPVEQGPALLGRVAGVREADGAFALAGPTKTKLTLLAAESVDKHPAAPAFLDDAVLADDVLGDAQIQIGAVAIEARLERGRACRSRRWLLRPS